MAPQSVTNHLPKFPNAAANLQRCLAGDWKIYILPLEISSVPANSCAPFSQDLSIGSKFSPSQSRDTVPLRQ